MIDDVGDVVRDVESLGINISDGGLGTITARSQRDTITTMSTSDAHAMTVRLPQPLLEVVDDHWHGQRLQSRHAAVIDMLWSAAGVKPKQEPSGDQLKLDLKIPGGAR